MTMQQNCGTCAYLDKSRQMKVSGCYLYGCSCSKRDNWTPCWINTDRLLSEISCDSHWFPVIREVRQMTIDDYFSDREGAVL